MYTCQGKIIQPGLAIGPMKILSSGRSTLVSPITVEDTAGETQRFQTARSMAANELRSLYDKALLDVGKSGSAIFEAYLLLLADEEYIDAVEKNIRDNKVNAEYAVAETSRALETVFSAIDDEYIRARAEDVRDISDRLIRILSGKKNENNYAKNLPGPVILYADKLSPMDILQLNRNMLLGLVTRSGSTNSHAAILARSLDLPALMGIEAGRLPDMTPVALDAYQGTLTFHPDQDTLHLLEEKKKNLEQQNRLLLELKGHPSITKDGHSISLYANISSQKEAENALSNDAEGIGLFRTEFLYMESPDFPTEETQFLAYKKTALLMAPKKVIIRTLDIGADKPTDYFKPEKEENPALGLRGIRVSLTYPDLLRTQLRAMYRASAYGRIAIMFPMITSLWELKKIKQIAAEVRAGLTEEKIPFREVELGIMIETPAAVMISDLLAEEADFFSIGSNDLTQYTLAVDRQNESLDDFYDPHHEALMRMLRLVTENAHKANIRVGICGELAADQSLTETFLKMGIDELSVSPSHILPLRKKIRETDLS